MADEVEIIEEEGTDEARNKIDKLKRDLEACRKEKEEYLSGWQRAKADFINYRKDEEKRAEEFVKFAGVGIFAELLDVADSLERAAGHSADEGVKNTLAQLTKYLDRNGISRIPALDETFDPARHEAVSEEPVEDSSRDNKIIEELQAGYMMYERVLRPARVKVGIYKINS